MYFAERIIRQTMRLHTAVFWATFMLVRIQRLAAYPDTLIDLSSKNLSSVPRDLPYTAVFLDLSCNHIHQIHKGDFKNTAVLKFLNVSWNGLEEIHPETFLDTPLLEHLDLSHNNLMNLLGQQYLQHTGNLQVLDLTRNLFVNMTLGSEFSSLAKLKALAIGATNISLGDFKNIVELKLRTLTLSLVDELGYESGSLKDVHAKRLQIDIRSFQTMNPDLFSDALQIFVEVELMNLTSGFKSLSKQLSERIEIKTSHFSLTDILIDWKDLANVVNVALERSIVHFTVSDLAIDHLPFIDCHVTKTSKMKSFTMRRAVVKSFLFSQECVSGFFINMPVEKLAIQETSVIYMTCPKLQSPILNIDFSNGAMTDSIFSRVEHQQIVECENLGNVRKLTLMDNNLKNLQLLSTRFQHMVSLHHLDLSLNSLVYDGLLNCSWPLSLTNMTLSSNGLTDSVFRCLPKRIETLDLQNNQIYVIPSSILKMEKLTSLNLNANRLRDLPVCNSFRALNQLFLKSNSLHVPSIKRLESCPYLKTLDVSHNPFTCTCALREFVSLGIKSENKERHTGIELLAWPQGYYCMYPEALRDSSLKDFWIPEVSCNVGILAVTILIPAVLLIVTTVVLCHRLDIPWYISMTWQWTRAKHRARQKQLGLENLEGIEFHAFVSYSQRDADWVHKFLFPNLEDPAAGLKISHHEKNFVAGKTIIENIIGCVEKSRCTVFVLSAHFVKSEWCHYELYFATHQRMSRDSESIVLVLLEPLPQYLIPSKYYQLKSMMKRHTYLEWPQDKVKQRLFWANLRAALQADLPTAPAVEIQE